jgi:hypothetical protein
VSQWIVPSLPCWQLRGFTLVCGVTTDRGDRRSPDSHRGDRRSPDSQRRARIHLRVAGFAQARLLLDRRWAHALGGVLRHRSRWQRKTT